MRAPAGTQRGREFLGPRALAGLVILAGLALAPGAYAVVLFGQVTDARGQPVADVDLDLDDATTGLRTPHDAETNSFGFYNLRVEPGVYHVHFDPPVLSRMVATSRRSVSLQRDTRLNVTLDDGVWLSGTVLDPDGRPVSGADLDASFARTGERIRTRDDATDTLGAFRLVVPTGVLRLAVNPVRGSGLAPLRVDSVNVQRDTALVLTVLPGVHLSGTVRDGGQRPVAGADIDVVDVGTGGRLSINDDHTAEGGAFDVIVPPGRFHVAFVPPAETGLAGTLVGDLDVSRDTSLDVVCLPGATLDVKVRGVFNEPIAGADLDFFRSDGVQQPIWDDVTDAQGRVTVVLAPGYYRLEVTPPEGTGLAAHRQTIDVGASGPLELVMRPDSQPLSLRIVSAFPNPTRETTEILVATPADALPAGTLYDVLGRRVARLSWTRRAAGYYSSRWDGRDSNGNLARDGCFHLVIEGGGARANALVVRMR